MYIELVNISKLTSFNAVLFCENPLHVVFEMFSPIKGVLL